AAPTAMRLPLIVAVTLAAAVFLAATVRSTSTAAHGVLARLVDEGVLPDRWRRLHPRFGTSFRLIDATAVSQVAAVFVSGGAIAWLARVYAVGVAPRAALQPAAPVRY